MPNCIEIVCRRLHGQELRVADLQSVIAELAAHLEEAYQAARARGLPENDALQVARQEVEDWHVLAREIERARTEERFMNHRTRSLWIPALITLLGASVSLAATQFIGLEPRLVWFAGMGMAFY